MTYVYEELFDIVLSFLLIIGAFGFLLIANPIVMESNEALPTGETVYSKTYQEIEEVVWTGSQVQYTLRDIEELNIPIRVEGFIFITEKDVKNHIHSISPTQNYKLQKSISANGEISEMQFFIR